MNQTSKIEKDLGHVEAGAMEQEWEGMGVATEESTRAEIGLISWEERAEDKSLERWPGVGQSGDTWPVSLGFGVRTS